VQKITAPTPFSKIVLFVPEIPKVKGWVGWEKEGEWKCKDGAVRYYANGLGRW
jgi:hypothetical protein